MGHSQGQEGVIGSSQLASGSRGVLYVTSTVRAELLPQMNFERRTNSPENACTGRKCGLLLVSKLDSAEPFGSPEPRFEKHCYTHILLWDLPTHLH